MLCLATAYTETLSFTLVVSGSVFLLAIVLMAIHWRSWKQHQRRVSDEPERRFRARQFRRRMQISGMLVSLAVFLLIGHFIRSPWLAVLFWGVLLLVVLWIVVLALFDVIASRNYYHRLQQDNQLGRARLEAELARRQRQSRDEG